LWLNFAVSPLSQSTNFHEPNGRHSTRRATISFRFKPADDIALLEEVDVARPWTVGHGKTKETWTEIATAACNTVKLTRDDWRRDPAVVTDRPSDHSCSGHRCFHGSDQSRHGLCAREVAAAEELATQVAGERFGTVVALVLTIGTFGGCVGCVRIVNDMVPHITQVIYAVFTTSTSYATLPHTTQLIVEKEVLWGLFLLIVFPLCSVKKLSGLQVTNYMGFGFSLLPVGATIYRAYTDQVKSRALPTPPPFTAAFQRLAQIVCIFTVSCAFTTHLNILPLFVQLRGTFEEPLQQSHVRMTQCIATVMMVCVVLYGVLGTLRPISTEHRPTAMS
jgi:hypothetical protein